MPWYFIIPAVAAGLFLIFALVEWLYTRVEPDRDSRHRAFAASGAVCLVGLCLLYVGAHYRAEAAASRRLANAAAIAGPLAELEQLVSPHLPLIEAIAGAQVKPTKGDLLEARRKLLEVRRQVASRFDSTSLTHALQNQSDTLLGVAYNTLGMQWTLAKEGQWDEPEQQRLATSSLQTELAKWKTLRDCLAAGRSDCSPTNTYAPKESVLRDFNRWLHPYAIELNRFEENDPDLVDLSVQERVRLADLITRGRAELADQDLAEWAEPVRAAADRIFVAAQLALVREQGAVSQGQWNASWQTTAYQPVRDAMQQYLQTALCASEAHQARCSGAE